MPSPLKARPPRKVLMTVDTVGGVWTYALGLARGLTMKGIAVDFAVLGPPPSPAQQRAADAVRGLKVSTTGLPLDWTAGTESALDSAVDALKAVAEASGADLVHLHAPGHAGMNRWELPLVVSAHSCVASWWQAVHGGELPADLAWRASRTARGIAVADAVIVPSRSFALTLSSIYGRQPHVAVVHNATRMTPVRAMPIRDSILTAGRLWDPAKNAATIDSAAALLDTTIHAAGPCHGPNGERATFSSLTLLGELSDIDLADWYGRTGIYISLARYEPFGLSVLEAACSGAALVLSDMPTFQELWAGAAIFVPWHDATAAADAVRSLRTDPRRRHELGERARARARFFSVRRNRDATLDIYLQASAKHEVRLQQKSAA